MAELTLKAVPENIPEVITFIDEQLDAQECSVRLRYQFHVVIDELFGNISRYAYPQGTGDATIRFEFDRQSRIVSILFIDGGIPFNPLERKDPDVSLPAEKRVIGGLGIFLVKKMMDRVEYRYENGNNYLAIYKRI